MKAGAVQRHSCVWLALAYGQTSPHTKWRQKVTVLRSRLRKKFQIRNFHLTTLIYPYLPQNSA